MKTLLLIITFLLSSCYVYEGTTTQNHNQSCELMERGQACLSDHSCCKPDNDLSYWRTNYVPTIGLYYYNELPYWGYYGGYYYYYGYRHIYPWWYYYNYTPSYYYSVSTHVYCHVGTRGYVYKPRGNWRHNNKKYFNYHHDKVNTTGLKIKDKSNIPTKWRNTKTNVTRTNNTTVKPNRTIKTNTTKSNTIKTNINIKNKTNTNKSNNKSNIKINKRPNIKINNKSNTRTNNRSNKTNIRKPR